MEASAQPDKLPVISFSSPYPVTPTTVQGQAVAIVVMLFGIAFLSVLTAAIASRFVKSERGSETEEILVALARLEAQLADLQRQVRGS